MSGEIGKGEEKRGTMYRAPTSALDGGVLASGIGC